MSSEPNRLELTVAFGEASFSGNGAKEDVLALYDDFKELIRGGIASPEGISGLKGDDSSQTQKKVKSPTSLPLKPYIERLKLPGNKEKATAVIAWSAESGGEQALNVAELKKLWKKLPFKVPANLARDLGKAESEGWLEREGRAGSPDARYTITGYGEDAVSQWLQTGD